MNVNLGKKSFLALRPEVYYDFIKARHPLGDIKTHSVTAPLNLVLQTSPAEIIGVAVFAGSYYSYRFDGKQGNKSLDFESFYHQNETGINYGVELRLLSFRVGVARRQAFTDFTRTKNDDGAHIRNRSVFATLSYYF
jgi:hypothetical protein